MKAMNFKELFKFRAMLKKLGIKYKADDNLQTGVFHTLSEDYGALYADNEPILINGFLCTLRENPTWIPDGYLEIHTKLKHEVEECLTADQAISRVKRVCKIPDSENDTLQGTISSKLCTADEIDAWHVINANSKKNVVFDIHFMECSECGRTYEYVYGFYEYCPRCGKKIIGVILNKVDN